MTSTAEKPYPFGAAHTYIADIREYPPPPPPAHRAFCTLILSAESMLEDLQKQATMTSGASQWTNQKKVKSTSGKFKSLPSLLFGDELVHLHILPKIFASSQHFP